MAKHLLGCALFIDLLLPFAIFSKVDNVNMLGAFTSLLRTVKEVNE